MCLAASVAGTLTSKPSATIRRARAPSDSGSIVETLRLKALSPRTASVSQPRTPKRDESGITSPDCSESQPALPHRITGRSRSAIRSPGSGRGGRTIPSASTPKGSPPASSQAKRRRSSTATYIRSGGRT